MKTSNSWANTSLIYIFFIAPEPQIHNALATSSNFLQKIMYQLNGYDKYQLNIFTPCESMNNDATLPRSNFLPSGSMSFTSKMSSKRIPAIPPCFLRRVYFKHVLLFLFRQFFEKGRFLFWISLFSIKYNIDHI